MHPRETENTPFYQHGLFIHACMLLFTVGILSFPLKGFLKRLSPGSPPSPDILFKHRALSFPVVPPLDQDVPVQPFLSLLLGFCNEFCLYFTRADWQPAEFIWKPDDNVRFPSLLHATLKNQGWKDSVEWYFMVPEGNGGTRGHAWVFISPDGCVINCHVSSSLMERLCRLTWFTDASTLWKKTQHGR